jgi:sugar phosphate isomerase/epimerase
MIRRTCKGRFPLRVGCTSYVYPADILPNVEKMAPLVDDVEIILFESQEAANMPDRQTVTALQVIAEKTHVTYTIHFPIDKKAGSTNRKERDGLFHQIEAIVALTRPLHPYGYILHLEGISQESTVRDKKQWYAACRKFCSKIVGIPEIDPHMICIENLFYPAEWHSDLVEQFGFSLCCDIGHLWLQQEKWEAQLFQWLPSTRIIHLHGVHGNEDHVSLKKSSLDNLVAALQIIKDCGYSHVISCEVFNEADTFESIELVGDIWQKLL